MGGADDRSLFDSDPFYHTSGPVFVKWSFCRCMYENNVSLHLLAVKNHVGGDEEEHIANIVIWHREQKQ